MKLVIAVDCQNDFIDGALGTVEAQRAVPAIAARLSAEDCALVVFTRDVHDGGYMSTQEGKNLPVPHCIDGTPGADINRDIFAAWRDNKNAIRLPFISDNTVIKHAFGADVLPGTVRRIAELYAIDEIEFMGFCTDICVISNALLLKAFFPDMPMSADASLCAGVTPHKHECALEVLRSCQICVKQCL